MTLKNKANLRDLIAPTGLVISNWIQVFNFSACATVKFDRRPKKTIGNFYTTWNFVHHFKSISEFKLDLQSGNAQFGSKSTIFLACDLQTWRMTLEKCPGSLPRQDISSHDIDYVEYVGPGLTWGRILSTCIISMWSNDIKCKYMFISLWKI